MIRKKITKEEFIKYYCKDSNMSWEKLSKYRVAVPCDCGDEMCDGWAMVDNDREIT